MTGGEAKTILVAEDEEMVRRMVRRVLTRVGYRVLEAEDGAEGVDVARSHEGPIDLLLTDVVMPRMSGPRLAAAMQEIRPETPVLFMSGYTGDEALRHGIRTGEVPFLPKPFEVEDLIARVREMLGDD